LQQKIDGLYRTTFRGVEVEVAAAVPTSRAAEMQASPKERFDELSEATFGLLGRQRPHVMKVAPCSLSRGMRT